jgi:hypothetical protein
MSDGHSQPHQNGHQVGAHALARYAVGSVGGPQAIRPKRLS